MAKKEGAGRLSVPITYTVHPTSSYSSSHLSLCYSVTLSCPLSVFTFFCPFLPICYPSLRTDVTPALCNVLKLARSMAGCCQYRLISHQSGWGGQLPHSGQTTMRGGWVSKCICVRLRVRYRRGIHTPGLINPAMTDNTYFQSIQLPV